MNAQIANFIKGKLAPVLPIDKIGGLVSTLVIPTPADGENEQYTEKRFPIAYDANAIDCVNSGNYREYIPDSESYTGVAYFEGQGLSLIGVSSGGNRYESRLRFVCWYNRRKITGIDHDTSLKTQLISIISRTLTNKFFNDDPLTRLKVRFVGIVDDPSIFAAYTYDEKTTQYLMAPLDYFAIDMAISYEVPDSCVLPINLNPAECL
jgi:hypothetical protein